MVIKVFILFFVPTSVITNAASVEKNDLEDAFGFDFSSTEAWDGIGYETTGSVGVGDTLALDGVDKMPTVDFPSGLNDAGNCTLMLVDPDAPSKENPRFRSWLHWLVVNVPCESKVITGDVITEYKPPSPPRGTGPHRYVFFLFKQPNPLRVDPITDRTCFIPEDFATKNGLGDPVYATYFYAEREME